MSIWHTSKPTYKEFPIWAYINDHDDVVLMRSENEYLEYQKHCINATITWTKANIPNPPQRDEVTEKFWVLRDSDCSLGWLPEDWFRAGYRYGKYCKGTCGCNKSQRVKEAVVPFEDPEREPNESAYDERA